MQFSALKNHCSFYMAMPLTNFVISNFRWGFPELYTYITNGQRILTRGHITRGIFHWENLMWHSTASVAGQQYVRNPMSEPLVGGVVKSWF